MQARARGWLVVVTLAACGSGDSTELSHQQPAFRIKVPAALKVGADKQGGDGGNLSVANSDHSKEVFMTWSRSGSPTDPVPQFGRHRQHEDLTKIVAEGELAGGGSFIHIERGNRTFVHSVIESDGYGIECTVSWPTSEPANEVLVNACKTLQPGAAATTAKSSGDEADKGARATFGAHPSIPAPLSKLRFGMPLEEVRATWPEALEYEFQPLGWDGVSRVNLMFNDKMVAAVFVHLAPGTGKALLSDAWGSGIDVGMTDLGPKSTWTGPDGLTAELTEQDGADVLTISNF